ncbi:MAG: DUF1850 domain-containing protein [Desulfobacterales bacterium]|jgi:hypothetical protein|nr:DUF1850 domain-containing protein [Desulfobacterales bacterium]
MSARKAILASTLAVFTLVGLMLLPVRTLEVRSRHRGAVVWRAQASPGDVVTFAYIHSIEKVPVEGRFAVEADGMLRVVETRFASYGAGLPAPTERSADGRWLVAPGGERIPVFSFYLSPINRAHLHFKDRTLALPELLPPGDLITLGTARFPWLLLRLKHPEERP